MGEAVPTVAYTVPGILCTCCSSSSEDDKMGTRGNTHLGERRMQVAILAEGLDALLRAVNRGEAVTMDERCKDAGELRWTYSTNP